MVAAPRFALKECQSHHALSVTTLLLSVFPSPESLSSMDRTSRVLSDAQALRERLPHNLHWVAEDANGKVVGAVEVYTTDYLQRIAAPDLPSQTLKALQPTLASLAVHPEARGHGIGKGLVRAVVEAARAAAAPGSKLLLQVESCNSAALRLYQSNGFRVVGPPRAGLYSLETDLAEEATTVAPTLGGPAPRASWLNPPAAPAPAAEAAPAAAPVAPAARASWLNPPASGC